MANALRRLYSENRNVRSAVGQRSLKSERDSRRHSRFR
jgi:hypothetical protein